MKRCWVKALENLTRLENLTKSRTEKNLFYIKGPQLDYSKSEALCLAEQSVISVVSNVHIPSCKTHWLLILNRKITLCFWCIYRVAKTQIKDYLQD